MRRMPLLAAVLVVTAVLLWLRPGLVRPARASTGLVTISNNAYHPRNLTVNAGDTVLWANVETSAISHTSTSVNSLWDSPSIAPNTLFTRTFTAPGRFSYFCRIHPSMQGQITVVDFTHLPLVQRELLSPTPTGSSFPPGTATAEAEGTLIALTAIAATATADAETETAMPFGTPTDTTFGTPTATAGPATLTAEATYIALTATAAAETEAWVPLEP